MPDIQFTFEVNDLVSGALDGIKATFEKAFEQDKTLAKFNAGLGQSAEITEEMGKLAKEVFTDGWGESLEDVTGAIGEVGAQLADLGNTSPDDVKKLTKGALDLAKVMGVDVTEVTRAAGQMMKNGLAPDAATALDVVARGYTSGANRAGDMLDVMGEYGPAFSALGLSSSDVLNMMNGALDNGAVSADKAGDAINEFGIRAIDGSKGTSEAFQILGLDAEKMANNIAGGGPKAQIAFGQILSELGKMTDPVAQETAGVALFGSMWEDMGSKAILAMAPTDVALEDLGTGVEEMGTQLNDVATNKVETMRRKFDEWTTSIVNTNGPFGTVVATAMAFGDPAMTLATNIGLIAIALRGTAIGAWAANAALGVMATLTGPIAIIAGSIAAVIALIKNAIDNIATLKAQAQSLLRGDIAGGSGGGWKIGQDPFNRFNLWSHAAGGIVTRPHLAMVGEGGEPEMILPLSKVGDMLSAAGGSGGGVTVKVYGTVVQETDLARTVQEAVAKARRQGTIPAGGF